MPKPATEPSSPRFFVTGASGFLGGHVLQALADAKLLGDTQLLIRDAALWAKSSLGRQFPQLKLIEGGLLEPHRWQKHLEPFDCLVHLAAIVHHSRHDVEQLWQVNVEGTRNMMEIAGARGARAIFVSSSGTVACSRRIDDAPDEDAPFATETVSRWPYYASKIQAEQVARYLADQHKTRLTILRPPAMYGPNDPRGRATKLIRQFVSGKLPFRLQGGINVCDVRDVAQAVATTAMHQTPRPIYHLPGRAESLKTFFQRLQRLSKAPAPRFAAPYMMAWPVAWLTTAMGRKLVGRPLPLRIDPVMIEMGRHHWNISSKYAESELSYFPRDVDQTLKDTLHSLSSAKG